MKNLNVSKESDERKKYVSDLIKEKVVKKVKN